MVPVRRHASHWHAYLAYGGLILALLLPITGQTESRTKHQAPPIQTQEKASSGVEDKENAASNKQVEQLLPINSASNTHQTDTPEGTKNGDDKGSEFWPPFYGYRLKITDSFLVLFTGVLCVFTGGLWFSTHRLWKAGEKQIAAASASAIAAQQAANIAQATLRAAYRPWLHLTAAVDGNIKYNPTNTVARMSIFIKNFGSSPAVGIEVKSAMIARPEFITDSKARLRELKNIIELDESNTTKITIFPSEDNTRIINVKSIEHSPEQKIILHEMLISAEYHTPGDDVIHKTSMTIILMYAHGVDKDGEDLGYSFQTLVSGEYTE